MDGIARFLLSGASPGPGVVALQIPITFPLGGRTLEVTTPDSVLRAHRAGYAVHVWLSNDEENARVYDRLLDLCVDGIMPARPLALERRLRARDVVGPDGRGTDPCGVRATTVRRRGRRLAVTLARRGLGPQAYRGTVTVQAGVERRRRSSAARRGRVLARGSFALRERASRGRVKLPLRRTLGGRRSVRVEVRTRGARGEPVVTNLALGR